MSSGKDIHENKLNLNDSRLKSSKEVEVLGIK